MIRGAVYVSGGKTQYIAFDEWNEQEHPRDDNGRWTAEGNKNMSYNTISEFFGVPYSEYTGKPKEAIEKLIKEQQGFVPAAIHKDGIGYIDFVYGKGGITGYGLAHIIEKHGIDIAKALPDLIDRGTVDNSQSHLGRSFIYSDDKKVVISLNYLNQERIWLLTAYDIDK